MNWQNLYVFLGYDDRKYVWINIMTLNTKIQKYLFEFDLNFEFIGLP